MTHYYIETDDVDTHMKALAEHVACVACRELGIPKVAVRWMRLTDVVTYMLAQGGLDFSFDGFARQTEPWDERVWELVEARPNVVAGGQYVPGSSEIWVLRDLNPSSLARVVAHECRHAYQFAAWPDGMAPPSRRRRHSEAVRRRWSESDAQAFARALVSKMLPGREGLRNVQILSREKG